MKDEKGNIISPYSIKYWINKGFSEKDSILEIRKRRPTNIEYWINKGFSEEEAKQKILEMCKKGSKTKKENPQKYKKYYNMNIEYWINKGFSEEEAKQKVSERQRTFTLKKCIEKYGKKEGTKRWEERQEKWQKTLKAKPAEEIERINKSKALTLENFVRKYGIEEGTKKYTERCLKCSNSLENNIKKYGIEEGTKKYKSWKTAMIKGMKNSLYSQESLTIFIELYEWLISRKYKQTDIFIGCNELGEFKLFENRKNVDGTIKCYFYDFTILHPVRLIIEYNGEAFHPNPLWNDEKLEKWQHPFNRKSAKEMYNYQKHKLELANSANFKVLEIWSSDTKEVNIQKCKDFILENECNLYNI